MVSDYVNVKNYESISAAIAAMGSKSVLFFPEGEYTWDLAPVSRDIIIIGQSAPVYDYDTNTMIGGSVLVGNVQLTGNNVAVYNIGVRRPVGSSGECLLVTSATLNSGKQATVKKTMGQKDTIGRDIVEEVIIFAENDSKLYNDLMVNYLHNFLRFLIHQQSLIQMGLV